MAQTQENKMSEDKVIRLGEKRDHSSAKGDSTTKDEEQNFEPVSCSFCGRPNTQVLKMVKGPGVNICSECAMIAVQYLILNDRMPSADAQKILDAFWGKAKR